MTITETPHWWFWLVDTEQTARWVFQNRNIQPSFSLPTPPPPFYTNINLPLSAQCRNKNVLHSISIPFMQNREPEGKNSNPTRIRLFFFFSKHTFFCSLVIKAFLNQSKSLLNCSHLHFFLLSDNLAGMKHWFCDINVTYSAGGQHFHLCLTGTSIWSPFFNTIASLSKPRLQTMNTRWRLWTWVIVFVGFKGLRDKKERIKVTCLGCRMSNRKYREYTEKRNTFGEDCLCTCFISYSFYSRQLTCMVWKRHWFVTILPVILAPNWHWKDADCANVVGPEFDAVSF